MKDGRLELRVEPELLKRIDEARGDVSRTRWVERALERALANLADVGESKVAKADRGVSLAPPRASRPAHSPTCKCALCKPPK